MPDAVPGRSGVRVLLAPNAFKGTLTAIQACAAMAAGVRQRWPLAEVVGLPMADGGDGFLRTVVAPPAGGRLRTTWCPAHCWTRCELPSAG